jgi:TonB family protein
MLGAIAFPQAGMAADAPKAPVVPIPHATLQCSEVEYMLSGCKVVEEVPEGDGLGAAAQIGSACIEMNKSNSGTGPVKQSDGNDDMIELDFQFPGARLPVAPNILGCKASLDLVMKPILWPKFLSKATGNDYEEYYPARANEDFVQGGVVVQCTINDGHLNGCLILKESPENYGFGQSTLKIMNRFRVAPLDDRGHPVEGGQFRTIVHWRIEEY